jgi:hypothetical protein
MRDVPLPGMPTKPTPARSSPPAGVHVTRFSPRTRQLCADCIALIHAVGVLKAPVPRPVRWRVSMGALTLSLCEAHKLKRLESRHE